MARYRRTRKYSRSHRGRWSANIQELGTSTIASIGPSTTFFRDTILAFNPIQTNTATSQVYTVKNMEVTFEITYSTTSEDYLEDITAYIMFVPQGMQITASYNLEHPEYIMAYKFLGSPTSDVNPGMQPTRVKTRLSRRLNTGDSIRLFIKGNNTSTQYTTSAEFHGLARWWTKAN